MNNKSKSVQMTLTSFVKKNNPLTKRSRESFDSGPNSYSQDTTLVNKLKKIKLNDSEKNSIDNISSLKLVQSPVSIINEEINLQINPENQNLSLDKKVEDKKNDLSSYPSFFQSLASEDDNKNEKSFLLCSPLQDNENLSDRDSISDDDKEEIKGGDPSSEQKSPKKRGPYKKGHDSKTKFIEDYIKKPDSPFFSWIFYDPKKDVLLCKICIDAKEKSRNIWGDPEIGCKIFKKYTCERHQESETHLKAVKTIKVVQKTLNIDYFQKSCSGKTKIELEGQFHEEYQNLFKNIIWSVQEELPILKITSLHKHTKESLGLDLPDYHTSTKSSNLIINAISELITQNILLI